MSITAYFGSGGHLVVPAQIDGLPVHFIAPFAFQNQAELTSVVLPEGVRSVGDGAFAGCSLLVSVVMSDTVTNLGAFAFQGCAKLTDLRLGKGLRELGAGCLSFCESLRQVSLPAGVRSVGDYAFYACESLRAVVAAGTAPTFGVETFAHADQVKMYVQPGADGWGEVNVGRPILPCQIALLELRRQAPPDAALVQFTVTGPEGIQVVIEAGSELVNSGWRPLAEVVLPPGPLVFRDAAATGLSQRFYRLRTR